MIDPIPLFDDEDAKPTAPKPVSVVPTVLDFTLTPESRPPSAAAYVPQAMGEDPLVPIALARGQTLFPVIMRRQGHIIRNLLGDLIPLDFARLSVVGRDTLDRSARLTIALGTLNGRFHTLGLESLINGIVEHAKAQAALSHKIGWRSVLASARPFDLEQARAQLDAARRTLERLMREVVACAEDVSRLDDILTAEVAAFAILNDLADHGPMGDLLSRRSSLLNSARQEMTIAANQADTLRRLAEQWIMRVDETRDVTLPAIGVSAKP